MYLPHYTAETRFTGNDMPAPADPHWEWVILRSGYMLDNKLAWPLTPEGERDAATVAKLLNKAVASGVERAQGAMREALGL